MDLNQTKLSTNVYDDFENIDFLRRPTNTDYLRLIEIMAKSFFIRDARTHEIIPCFSHFHLEGLACPIFSSKEDCILKCKDYEAAYDAELEIVTIAGIWSFFIQCAQSGCVGILLDDTFPVRFYNRISDLDRDNPTIHFLRIPTALDGKNGVFFSKRGIIDLELGRTIKWNNYEKTDKKIVKYASFGSAVPGDHFSPCTILSSKGEPIFFQDSNTFLGAYISMEGAIPIFSDSTTAKYFSATIGLLNPTDKTTLIDGYTVVPIDLTSFLNKCSNKFPFTDFILNPNYQRGFQGRFYSNSSHWLLQTVSGVWLINDQELSKLTEFDLPKGYLGMPEESILALHGITSQIKFPFKRLVGSDQSLFSSEDADDLVDEEFHIFHEPLHIAEDAIPATDSFCIDAFDKVSGERFALSGYDDTCNDLGFLIFPDLVSAASYLSNTILEIDENARINGYRLCDGTGQQGTENPDKEKKITDDMRLALKKIVQNALTSGYSPKHGMLIKKLLKDVSGTCEIIECGYFGDLLFYDLSNGLEMETRIEEIYEEEDQELEYKAQQTKKKISKSRLKLQQNSDLSDDMKLLLRASLGATLLDLTTDSLSIAKTAIEEFSKVGKRIDYDYAGISMKIAKIFERELSIRIFRTWRSVSIQKFGKHVIKSIIDKQNVNLSETDLLLSDYFSKRRRTDLGGMKFVLKEIDKKLPNGSITQHFKDFVLSLSDPDWLMSDEFSAILYDISTRYRNGGVHEHIVGFEVCDEAIKRILTGENPALKRLISSTLLS